MKTLEEFKKEIRQLSDDIENHYEKEEEPGVREVIGDGIADVEKYYNASPKILWILKEAYDKENNGKGGGVIAENLFNRGWMLGKNRSKGTWHPIIYTSYAILNSNIGCYNDMDFIAGDPSMIDVLQKIAFINVSKFAGGTTSNNREISKAYQKHKEILLKQIKIFNSDVIIGGNTIRNFIDDLGLKDVPEEYDEYNFWRKDDKIYIAADHPARKRGKEWEEEYVDSILNIVRKNLKK